MVSKEAILSSAKLVKGIIDGTAYNDDFYKDDDVTEKVPSEMTKKQKLEILKCNMDFVKNNDKYLEEFVLDENESDLINFSKSETVSTFLENGTKNWDNHGGGGSKTLFSNLQLNVLKIFGNKLEKLNINFVSNVLISNIALLFN